MDLSDFIYPTSGSEKHEYRLGGEIMPSVTQIISPLQDFSHVRHDVLERAKRFGTAVHMATVLSDQEDLDEDNLDPSLVPCLNAWRKFKSETGFVSEHIELPLYSPIHRFAGTIDRIGSMSHYADQKLRGRRMILDIKTGSTIYPTVGLQTAAYRILWNERYPTARVVSRCSVRLFTNGTYRLDFFGDRMDVKVFLALLHKRDLNALIMSWITKNGLNLTPDGLLETIEMGE